MIKRVILLIVGTWIAVPGLLAQPIEDTEEELLFTHPLISESVSPDNKLRLDYDFEDLRGDVTKNTVTLGAEYAFHRSFSVELVLPYVNRNPMSGPADNRFCTIYTSLKFANFSFADSGILLGYGMEFGLPTGNDDVGIGSDNILEVNPYLNVGIKSGNWEWTGHSTFIIPTGLEADQDFQTLFGLNLTSLYRFSNTFQALLELDGEAALSGEGAGEESEYHLTPGIKAAPLADKRFQTGLGLRMPISEDPGSELFALVSLFYHFN